MSTPIEIPPDWRAYSRSDKAGYRPLADLMGTQPDLAIFRRFRNVASLDLLYRQSELQIALSRWVEAIQLDRATGDVDKLDCDIEVARLLGSIEDENKLGAQYSQWVEVSAKLAEYYDRLLKFQKICALPPADKYNLKQLKHHLDVARNGDMFLRGVEAWNYRYNQADLTSITAPSDPDLFSRFSHGRYVDWLQKFIYGKIRRHTIEVTKIAEEDKSYKFFMEEYSPETLSVFSRVLVSILTTIFITMAILTLNIVQQAKLRILLIFLHNLLFSVSMAWLARARAAEVFAISAAYAAVLVVYASGSSGLGSKPDS